MPLLTVGAFLLRVWDTSLQAAENPPGLSVTLTSQGATDVVRLDQVLLYVPAGESPSPFVPPGRFTAVWDGFIHADIRADFTFHADAVGALSLAINGTNVLQGTATAGQRLESSNVRLNKGANKLRLEYRAPPEGDAFVRLNWANRETPLNPIPKSAFTHSATVELTRSSEVHAGRDLFAEFRCGKCHEAPTGMRELQRDAPDLSGIGSLRPFDWLAGWVDHPRSIMPGRMPRVFVGPDAQQKAEAVAAYLSSLRQAAPIESAPGNIERGRSLYDQLECQACHTLAKPTVAEGSAIPLVNVGLKFSAAVLARFLEKPEERYAWTRMPNFKLSAGEAEDLAAWLLSQSIPPTERSTPTSPSMIDEGKRLVVNSGCLNCHSLGEARTALVATPLAALAADRWTVGCLAEVRANDSKAPWFDLTESERKALRAFAATDRTSLAWHVPADFVARQSEHLNCRACHGKIEKVPAFDLIGAKLRPEWSSKFIAGQLDVKPRPWLEARMPAFPAYAENLAVGLAAQHGLPPHTRAEPLGNPELAEIGRTLVSSKGGFSCISCHSAAEFAATRVFEAPAINFALSHDRLQPDFFRRWVRSPLSIDPMSKMPVFFDEEGRSPLREMFDGDGPKTIQAIWEYLRLGDQMPPPE